MPVPEALGFISFAATAFGLLTTSVSNLNALRHNVGKFRRRVETLQRTVETCEAVLLAWNNAWNYNNYSQDVYRFLWGQHYDAITNARAAVDRDARDLQNHIESVLGTTSSNPRWKRIFALHRTEILRRLAYALCSDASLSREITQLKDNLGNLQILSDLRLKSLSGTRLITPITAPLATRLGNLVEFGRDLFQNLRQMGMASDWALELRPPQKDWDAEAWRDMKFLQVWLMFIDGSPQDGQWRRVTLRYALGDRTSPDDWAFWVVNPGDNANPPGQVFNPTVSDDRLHAPKTVPFRTLFKQGFFDSRPVYKAWEADQAHLLLSLSNWAILLWKSDWTTNICCSGIRFVRVGTDAEAARVKGPCLHSLTIQQSHDRVQHGRQVQQAGNEECYHRNPRSKDLGLVLAETICATPFRQPATDTSHKSGSDKLRKAVEFCLNADDTADDADGIASFYLEYIEQVLTPVWCKRLQDNQRRYIDDVVVALLGKAWPNGAFEVPTAVEAV
ncbi:hypothetical protein BFJ71_g15607 [Fusarium oxysporum]|nr:hypothetical protein BFJ71_g15607 [Fusarium oxysporum]